jgi:ubiquinone/menaquinone biosynthesis C-methylase UbiE
MPYIAKSYKRYKFQSGARFIRGRQPDFKGLLLKKIRPSSIVLDLGCGSGELTLDLSAHCQKIIGIDVSREYIKTARQDKAGKKIRNASFLAADAAKLPFKAGTFDLIYSSRGPLSAGREFMRESLRVLKPGGLLAEETIGETDKIELKEIFGRGQNYPVVETKLHSVKSLLKKHGVKPLFSKNYIYYQLFPSYRAVLKILLRAPIIPDFDPVKDKPGLDKIKKLDKGRGIILGAHRLLWTGQKI